MMYKYLSNDEFNKITNNLKSLTDELLEANVKTYFNDSNKFLRLHFSASDNNIKEELLFESHKNRELMQIYRKELNDRNIIGWWNNNGIDLDEDLTDLSVRDLKNRITVYSYEVDKMQQNIEDKSLSEYTRQNEAIKLDHTLKAIEKYRSKLSGDSVYNKMQQLKAEYDNELKKIRETINGSSKDELETKINKPRIEQQTITEEEIKKISDNVRHLLQMSKLKEIQKKKNNKTVAGKANKTNSNKGNSGRKGKEVIIYYKGAQYKGTVKELCSKFHFSRATVLRHKIS